MKRSSAITGWLACITASKLRRCAHDRRHPLPPVAPLHLPPPPRDAEAAGGGVMRIPALLLAAASIAHAETPREWKYSLAAVSAASAADIHSSWRGPESNPLLSGADGRFGARGVAIKGGIVAANLAVQYVVVRRWPGLARRLARINFVMAGATGAVAVRNYGVSR